MKLFVLCYTPVFFTREISTLNFLRPWVVCKMHMYIEYCEQYVLIAIIKICRRWLKTRKCSITIICKINIYKHICNGIVVAVAVTMTVTVTVTVAVAVAVAFGDCRLVYHISLLFKHFFIYNKHTYQKYSLFCWFYVYTLLQFIH